VAGFEGGIPFAIVQAKRLRVQGVTVGSRRDQMELVRAFEANGIKPVIDRTFPLAELPDAFRYLQSGQHFGKICIDI
jgi:NADPH:quinone reductase-like Zn-dependent oxidoreductase